MARRLFSGRTAAEVFAKAQHWVSEHEVFLVDVSWNWVHDEPERAYSVCFTVEHDADAQDQVSAGCDCLRSDNASGRRSSPFSSAVVRAWSH